MIAAAEVKRRSLARSREVARILRRPLAALAALWISGVLVCALFAPVLAPSNPLAQDLTSVLAGPSQGHLLGTDDLGRDVLSRLMYGARDTFLAVGEAIGVWLAIGLCLGLLAGYVGGWVDQLVMRLTELAYALPAIIMLLVVLAVFSNNDQIAMVVFGLIMSAGLARVVRGSALAVREEAYITAAKVSGLGAPRIMVRHMLPRLRTLVIVQASVFAGLALVTETGLAFLGFGPQPPNPSWGGMIADAETVLQRQPWLMVPPAAAIVLTVLAFGILGDAVRDASADKRAGRVRSSMPGTTASVIGTVAPPSEDAVLSIRSLTVAFPVGGRLVNVVERVDLDVRPGEAVGLVGESGSGKTVTALSALNALPAGGRIVSGRCVFDGHNLFGLDPATLRRLRGRRVGFIGQDPMVSLDPNFTILALLSEAIRSHTGQDRRAARDRALDLLRRVSLPDPDGIARRRAFELSGGMAQRVAIALALAGEPSLLIADEPTTALDVTVQAEVLALLRRLQAETGMAILLVTHDWGVVASICHRAAVMYAGQIVEQGLVTELFTRPQHPYTKALLAANPHLAEKGRPLTAIPGTVPLATEWPAGCHFSERCPIATPECAAAPIPLVTLGDERVVRCIRAGREEFVETG